MFRVTKDCMEAAAGRWPAEDHSQPRRADRPKTIRVFENGFVELLAKAHPITPGLWFGPFIAWCWMAWPAKLGWGLTAALFFSGAFAFTLCEYVIHRYAFHGMLHSAHDDASRFRAFMVHGYHHEFPDDRLRLVMPPMISWPLAVLFAVVYYFAFGPAHFFPILTGTMAGYIAYDWMHYYEHHFHPRGGLGKWLRVYHLKHHFQEPDLRYGITTPFWDVIFGTMGTGNRWQPASEGAAKAA